MKSIRVACAKDNLWVIREFVKSGLNEFELSGKVRNQITVAVEEACANSIIHQHKCDRNVQLEIRLYRKGNELNIEIKDPGKPFPIDHYRSRSLNDIIKMRAKGGLGILLIHKIMDSIDIRPAKDHCVYRFTKHI